MEGGTMVDRTHEHVERVGQHIVTNAWGEASVCNKCGEVELYLNELAWYQRRAAAIVLRESTSIDGAVVKYARRSLGLKQTELAELLGVRHETLSRWETDSEEMPRTAQLGLVAILDGVEQMDGDVQAFVRRARAKTRRPSRRHVVPLHTSFRRLADGR
jgi:putative zinc finger/helix-turn-helix YgiT family protein